MIDRALLVLSPEQFWINPDCGLKTRKQGETVAASQYGRSHYSCAREIYGPH